MSQENVEIVRGANEAFNRGDIEEVLTFYDENVEVEDLMNAPDVPRMTHGIQEYRQMLTAWMQTFDDEFRAEIVEFIDEGQYVVRVTDYYGKSREGPTTHLRVADVVECRNGKIVRVTFGYENREKALEAVALSEQDAQTGF
jgi:ketosteroid isomerase-like protein